MFDLGDNDFSSFGDIIKEKTFRRNAEDRLKVTEKLISDPSVWIGSSKIDERSVDNPEIWAGELNASEELRSAMYPKIGRKLHPSVLEDQLNLEGHEAETIEDLALNTYSAILEEDPRSAEEFKNTFHIDFDGRSAVVERVNELLSDYNDLFAEENKERQDLQSKAVKEALALVNQTEYELDGSDLDRDYMFEARSNRDLEQQLSDEVFSRLDGEAQAFFDYARREDAPEGVHFNFNINAQPADNYDLIAQLEERAKQLKEEFTTESDPSEVIDNHEDLYDAMNVSKLVERAGLGQRFDMDQKDVYQEEAQAYVDTWMDRIVSMQEEGSSYADSIMKDLESANEYPGPDREEMSETMTEKVDAVLDHIDYLKDQIDGGLDNNLSHAQERIQERREPEEKDSGFLNGLLS